MRFLRNLAVLFAAVLIPATSMAVVPDATLSSYPECMRIDPYGGFFNSVDPTIIIGTDGGPIVGEEARLIFDSLCVDGDHTTAGGDIVSCRTFVGGVVFGTTGGDGTVTWAEEPGANVLSMGGCCEVANACKLQADPAGVDLKFYDTIGSSDNSSSGAPGLGDLVVGATDFQQFFAAFQEPVGTFLPCHDYLLCDELVILTEFQVFQSWFLVPGTCP